ncbi:hypothetical protein [Duganella violaceipulchra]|uniref:Uncharacterized protein n=1 Tax=Duganella violaceipulchra TaxID=2849652 RepID=A0AA41HFF9_9BURK|nr:hypothetical protein [Duganella violaceicalia]MBV6325085.1 hypothetical protein [Duganella violaceicalia]MCP2010599.1 hypothetical protein [Duganella violaceicalia]
MKLNKTLKFDTSLDIKSQLLKASAQSAGIETSYRPWNAAFVSCHTPVVAPAKRS